MILMSFPRDNKSFVVNLILAFIPISYILGNLVLNLNILVLIISIFIFYGLDVFKIELNIIDKLLIFFLFISLLMGQLIIFFTLNLKMHRQISFLQNHYYI